MKNNTDLFNQAVFNYNYRNIPIPNNTNTATFAKEFGVNSLLFSLMDHKAKKTSQIKPIIVKETDKAAAKEFRKWNGKYTERYEMKKLKGLQTKAFEELYMDDIQESNGELFKLKTLLTRPNSYQTWSEFMFAYSMFLDLAGWAAMYGAKMESGIYKGHYQNLYQLPTDKLEIMGGTPFDPVTGYRFKSTYKDTFPAEDVVAINSFSFNYDQYGSHLYGTSKVQVAWKDLETYIASKTREYNSFNGGDLRAIVTPKSVDDVPVEAQTDGTNFFKAIKDSFYRALRGTDKQKIAFNSMPLEVHQLVNDLKTDVTTNAQQEIKQCLASVWRFDSDFVFSSANSSTYENMRQYSANSLRNGVFPDLIKHEEAFNENIVKPIYKGHGVIYDYDVYEELNTDIFKEMEALQKADYISDNVKLRYLDLEPIEDERANIPAKYWEMAPPIEPLDSDGEI